MKVCVVTVNNLPETYTEPKKVARALMEEWGIAGLKDKSVLIMLFKKERRLAIEIGYVSFLTFDRAWPCLSVADYDLIFFFSRLLYVEEDWRLF